MLAFILQSLWTTCLGIKGNDMLANALHLSFCLGGQMPLCSCLWEILLGGEHFTLPCECSGVLLFSFLPLARFSLASGRGEVKAQSGHRRTPLLSLVRCSKSTGMSLMGDPSLPLGTVSCSILPLLCGEHPNHNFYQLRAEKASLPSSINSSSSCEKFSFAPKKKPLEEDYR